MSKLQTNVKNKFYIPYRPQPPEWMLVCHYVLKSFLVLRL